MTLPWTSGPTESSSEFARFQRAGYARTATSTAGRRASSGSCSRGRTLTFLGSAWSVRTVRSRRGRGSESCCSQRECPCEATASISEKRGFRRSCDECLGGQRLEGEAEPLVELAVEQPPVPVEALVRPGDRKLVTDDARARGAEDLAQIRLRPHRAELADARTDHSDGLVGQRGFELGARGPVDGVLEPAGNRAVVLGRREEDRVRRAPLLAQPGDGRRNLSVFQILVVDRQVAEAGRIEELDLDTLRRGLDRRAQKARVVRVGPQAAGHGQDLHRYASALTNASSAMSFTSLAR